MKSFKEIYNVNLKKQNDTASFVTMETLLDAVSFC